MVDWASVDWWDLPGPSRFVARTADLIASAPGGVAGMLLPDPRPGGLLEVLERHVERSGSRVLRVDLGPVAGRRSPTSILAAVAGVSVNGIRSVGEFVDEPSLSETVFLVDGIRPVDWQPWAMFLRRVRSERMRRTRILAPSIAVIAPTGVPLNDWRAAVEKDVKWSGQVTRLDTQAYVERAMGWPDDTLASRTAVAVTVELSGWDPSMARALAALDLEAQIDPREALASLPDVLGGRHPCWANGLVDRWDGGSWLHTAALAESDFPEVLRARVWRGQVRIVFPFLEQIRTAFAARYEQRLRAALPISKEYHGKEKVYDDPWTLELHDVHASLKDGLPQNEERLLRWCKHVRRCMAHHEPAEGWRLKQLSDEWEAVEHEFPDACRGWQWPRTGQKLVLMVGPSGAGKTEWARRHCDRSEIISSDAIREEIFGSADMGGDQTEVFDRVRRDALSRLSTGRTAVIDATNLKREDRLPNARLAPLDIPVEYVLIDRPMAEKISTAREGTERERAVMGIHAGLLERGLAEILAGDAQPNVKVVDLRKTADADREISPVVAE